MKRYSFPIAFGLGALAVVWVAAAVATSHRLVLGMAAVIGLVYVYGALELRHYRSETGRLSQALSSLPPALSDLNDWLLTLPVALQNPVRQRVEGERASLPGPALTPYLVGLLVMLGMLGTFLGMVVTLNGAVFALEGSSNVAGIRAAFSEPIKGLGVAFGTSVAGVATSAMLGLMSSLARRERFEASQQLDTQVATGLRRFSMAHQRQETLQALQQQTQALPQVVQQLQTLITHMAHASEQSNERLLASQQNFQAQVHAAYRDLAQSVDQSLRSSMSESLQAANAAMGPVVQATLTQMAQQVSRMNDHLQHTTQQQLDELNTQFKATTASVAQTYHTTLLEQDRINAAMVARLGQTLETFGQNFDERSQALVNSVHTAWDQQQTRQHTLDQHRLEGWKASLENTAHQLSAHWQASGEKTLGQQQALCDTLTRTAQAITTHTQTQTSRILAEIDRLMASSDALMGARIASEAQWAQAHTRQSQEFGRLLREELAALRVAEDARGQAAVARLAELQTAVTAHLGTLGNALQAPITRLIETASEAPKAAAEVMAQLRQEISVHVARDNDLLQERSRIMATLNKLLDAIHHASNEQRHVIDGLVSSSASALSQVNQQFVTTLNSGSTQLGDMAAQVSASAVDVASLSETLGFAVRSFSASNEQLTANLQRIEQAIDKSMVRSDEQLAYYVAQAREIIDLSISSQKDVLETLQHRAAQATEGVV